MEHYLVPHLAKQREHCLVMHLEHHLVLHLVYPLAESCGRWLELNWPIHLEWSWAGNWDEHWDRQMDCQKVTQMVKHWVQHLERSLAYH